MSTIQLSYPVWSLVLIAVLSVFIASILYFKNKNHSSKLTIILFALRSIGVLAILLLLLNPFINQSLQNEKKAKIIFLQDQSTSVANFTNNQTIETYLTNSHSFISDLEQDHPVETYAFGSEVFQKDIDSNFSQEATDLYQALQYLDAMYESDHVGAVVLATDGIYNRGADPAYFKFKNDIPLLIYGMGDTSKRADVKIQQILYNEIVRKNETSEIEVDIKGFNMEQSNLQVSLQLLDNGSWTTLETINTPVNQKEFFKTLMFQKKYETPGLEQMRVRITGAKNDIQPANNIRTFYVEVLETTRNIAIIGEQPHPDIGALKELLTTKNNKVTVYIQDGKTKLPAMEEVDLWVLYQLDDRRQMDDYTQKILDAKKPIFYINGINTNDKMVNDLQTLVNVSIKSRQSNQYTGVLNSNFDYFSIDPTWNKLFTKLPPLTNRFGEYNLIGNGQNLLTQQIGDVETQLPSLVLGESTTGRIALLYGEGIWKWKLYEYLENDNNEILSDFMDKIVEFISQQKDDRLFRLQKTKLLFDETENISFSAELYNPALEKISEPDVFFELKDENGNTSEYTFDKIGLQYKLNLGKLPPGRYQYIAKTQSVGESYSESGSFTVADIQLENYQLEANHQLLANMAHNNNGELFYDMDSIAITIDQLPSMQSYLVESNIKNPLIDWKILALIIIALLAAEWIIRRYSGGY